MKRLLSLGLALLAALCVANVPASWARHARGAPAATSGGGFSFAQDRPTGLTTALDRQWSPSDGTAGTLPPAANGTADSYGMNWYAGSGYYAPVIASPASLSSTIGVNVPNSPDNAATVMAVYYPSGFSAGETPMIIDGPSFGPARELYICMYIFIPSNFNKNGNQIKGWNIQNDAPSNNSANHVAMLIEQFVGDQRMAGLYLQGGGVGSQVGYGAGASTPSGALVGPLPEGEFDQTGYAYGSQLGEWHMLEWYFQRETTPGSSGDGVFKSYVDGVQINGWANLNYESTTGFGLGDNFAFIPYYGGGGSAAPAAQYLVVGHTQVAYAN